MVGTYTTGKWEKKGEISAFSAATMVICMYLQLLFPRLLLFFLHGVLLQHYEGARHGDGSALRPPSLQQQ